MKLPPSSDYLARKPFQSNGGGLVTAAADWIHASRMLLNSSDGARILKPATVAAMGTNHHASRSPLFWHDAGATTDGGAFSTTSTAGFGYAIGVRLPPGPAAIRSTPGGLGQAGGHYLGDRQHRLVALVFAQYRRPTTANRIACCTEACTAAAAGRVTERSTDYIRIAGAEHPPEPLPPRARREDRYGTLTIALRLVDTRAARHRLRLHRTARAVASRQQSPERSRPGAIARPVRAVAGIRADRCLRLAERHSADPGEAAGWQLRLGHAIHGYSAPADARHATGRLADLSAEGDAVPFFGFTLPPLVAESRAANGSENHGSSRQAGLPWSGCCTPPSPVPPLRGATTRC